MKVFYICVWGGGTPKYLVSAETKERAWELVQNEWKKTYDGNIGSDYYHRDRCQTIDSLIELDFLADKECIIDLSNM